MLRTPTLALSALALWAGFSLCPLPSEAADSAVTSLTLINTDTDRPVPGYQSITQATTLKLADLPKNYTLSANTEPSKAGDGLKKEATAATRGRLHTNRHP